MEEQNVYTGRVVNGVVVLDDGALLPEGQAVKVEPVTADGEESAESLRAVSRLRETLLKHAGTITDSDLPTDLADNLDHYLYGTPKGK